MRKNLIDCKRYVKGLNRRERLRYGKMPAQRFAMIPVLAAIAVTGALLAALLPLWLGGGKTGLSEANASASVEATFFQGKRSGQNNYAGNAKPK